MFHFENTAIWTSEFSQFLTPKQECCLVEKRLFLLIFGSKLFQVLEDMFMRKYEVKRKSFYGKSELQMFLLISRRPYWCTKTVHQYGVSIRSSTKVRETFRQKNSETVGHKDLRQIVYILVFYNIAFSWFLPLDGFQFIFLLRDSGNDLYTLRKNWTHPQAWYNSEKNHWRLKERIKEKQP